MSTAESTATNHPAMSPATPPTTITARSRSRAVIVSSSFSIPDRSSTW